VATSIPDVAASYNNIAIIYKKQGKYEEALKVYTKSLDIKTRIYGGDNHPDVAKSYLGIGNVYDSQGQYERALENHQKALEIFIKVCGQDHPSVADSKYNLALLHKKRKETDIARQLFLECEQIYTIVYGPHHRETVDAVRQASLCV
jgi:tetratricopeptide (TPR) repeat protein